MSVLTPGEEQVMRDTFQAAMLRAAAIIDAITQDDVADAQAAMFAQGVRLADLTKIDRALIASCHLRSCAVMPGNTPDNDRAELIAETLLARVRA